MLNHSHGSFMRKVSAKAKYSEAKPTHLPVFQWVKSNNLIQKK